MKRFSTTLIAAAFSLAGAAAFAEDAPSKAGTMPADGAMPKEMTAQQCKDRMAMVKKSDTSKDAAMMRQDKLCAEVMKKEGMPATPSGAASMPGAK